MTEDSLFGKWYGVLYCTKRTSKLFVVKILKRFVADENGLVENLEVRCLKPKVGSSILFHFEDKNGYLLKLIHGT